LTAVESYLTSVPYSVTTFSSGSHALEALTSKAAALPDLIVSDVNMPGLSGLELLRSIRSSPSPALSTVPVVLLTARGMTEDRIEGYKAECDGYVSKPFDPEELRVVVEVLLKRRRSGGGSSGGVKAASGKEASIESVQESIEELKALMLDRSVGGGAAAFSGGAAGVDNAPPFLLTPKESMVLRHISEGLMNKEIAPKMGISVRSVERHVTNLLEKSGARSRTELLAWAYERGWV